jgi:hypothetical protein
VELHPVMSLDDLKKGIPQAIAEVNSYRYWNVISNKFLSGCDNSRVEVCDRMSVYGLRDSVTTDVEDGEDGKKRIGSMTWQAS